MQEELISYITAKLAKEKGFELNSCSYYQLYEEGQSKYTTHIEGEDSDQGSWVNEDIQNRIAITTQSLLQKWLREVHNFHITICNTNPGVKVDFKFSMSELYKSDNDDSKKYIVLGSKGTFRTYEEALEIALQESLKLIN